MAVSECHSTRGLQPHYDIEFYGYTNHDELCAAPKLLVSRWATLMAAMLLAALIRRTSSFS